MEGRELGGGELGVGTVPLCESLLVQAQQHRCECRGVWFMSCGSNAIIQVPEKSWSAHAPAAYI